MDLETPILMFNKDGKYVVMRLEEVRPAQPHEKSMLEHTMLNLPNSYSHFRSALSTCRPQMSCKRAVLAEYD